MTHILNKLYMDNYCNFEKDTTQQLGLIRIKDFGLLPQIWVS